MSEVHRLRSLFKESHFIGKLLIHQIREYQYMNCLVYYNYIHTLYIPDSKHMSFKHQITSFDDIK